MPSPHPCCHLVHRPYNQARRVGGTALGARYTAISMIPGNGVVDGVLQMARSDSTIGGTTIGGSVNGDSIICVVSIAAFSVAFSIISRRGGCGKLFPERKRINDL